MSLTLYTPDGLRVIDSSEVKEVHRLDDGDDNAHTIAKATVLLKKDNELLTGNCRADHLVKLMARVPPVRR